MLAEDAQDVLSIAHASPYSFSTRDAHVTTFRTQPQAHTTAAIRTMKRLCHVLVWSVDRIAARPLPFVVISIVLAAGALVVSLQHLRIDTSTTEMISPEVPFRRHQAAFQRAFPEFDDTIVAVIEGPLPERAEQAASALADELRASEHFTAVDYPPGHPFFARNGLLYLPLDELAALTDRLAAAQPLLAALAADPSLRGLADFLALAVGYQTAGSEPASDLDGLLDAMARVVEAELAGRFGELSWQTALAGEGATSPDREVVIAQPRLDYDSMAPAAAAIAALRAEAADLGIAPEHGLRLTLTGAAVLDTEELESVGSGALLASVLTTLAVAALLVWGLRSLRLIAATLLTLAVGLILTACFATLSIGRLNLISITFAVLFVGLGVDFGIHLALRFQETLAAEARRRAALRAATAGVGGPLSLSALCAAVGFLAFVPTDYQGLAELGIISTAGMVIAWLASLTLLPALLAMLRPQLKPVERRGAPRRPLRRPGLVVMIAALAGVASLPALSAVRFDFNPLNLKDPHSESMRAFDRLAADPATSPHVIDVLAPSLEQADALAARLEALDEVREALTLSSFVPETQDEKLELIESLAFYLGPALAPPDRITPSTPEERRAALAELRALLADAAAGSGAARLAAALARFGPDPPDAALAELEARLTGTLPGLLERLRQALDARPVDRHDLPAEVREQWVNERGEARILVRPAVPILNNAVLKQFARAVLAVAPDATGTPIVVMEGAEEVVRAFREASALALAFITVLLAVVLRNARDLVFVLAPLGLAVLFTAASAVLLDLQLNFANVIVLPLLLGLGVSGALHVVMRWRDEGQGGDLAATSTPRAVLFSGLTTVASFGSLAISAHPGLASMGLLLTIAIFWSLVCSLLILPSILALASPREAGTA
jgi:hopanoid biosynthesis associated RND transporter like protein HpnN